jgi:protein-disulfide isomerase
MHKCVIMLGIIAVSGIACRKTDQSADIIERLDRIEKSVEELKKRPAGAAAAANQPRRPDPNTVYNVPVGDHDVAKGPKFAKVTIVEGFDFACPYCAQARPAVEEAFAKHKDDVKVVSKQFVVHPQVATLPALAVCAAQKQGKGPELSDEIWARSWKQDDPNGRAKFDATQLNQENIEKTAADKKLDVAKLKADMQSKECQDMLATQQRELAAVGVNGTPAFFINGKPYSGPRTAEGFNAAVEEEIKKADAALKSGTKLEDYYAAIMKTAAKSL